MISLQPLDTASFDELVQKCISEIPELCEEWTDFNSHDPGVTFVELLMWLIEMQRYYISQITDEHLKSFLSLLGAASDTAAPSRVVALFQPLEEEVFLPRNREIDIEGILFLLDSDLTVSPSNIMVSHCCNEGWTSPNGFSLFHESGEFFIKVTRVVSTTIPFYFGFCVSKENSNICTSKMQKGFTPQAAIEVKYLGDDGWKECAVEDETFGFMESGFVTVTLPNGIGNNECVFSVTLSTSDIYPIPPLALLTINAMTMTQANANIAERVKENLQFSFTIDGKIVSASTYCEVDAGCSGETPAEALARQISFMEHPCRAVSEDDYRRIVLKTPGLRARDISVYSERAGKVSVAVYAEKLPVSMIKNIRQNLFVAKPIGIEIEVVGHTSHYARLFVGVRRSPGAGTGQLHRLVRGIVCRFEERLGVVFPLGELCCALAESPLVERVDWVSLKFDNGNTFSKKETLRLPPDGVLVIDSIVI